MKNIVKKHTKGKNILNGRIGKYDSGLVPASEVVKRGIKKKINEIKQGIRFFAYRR